MLTSILRTALERARARAATHVARWRSRARAQARALRRAGGGSVAIEFSLAAPLMVAVLVPMVDLGLGIYQRMQVQDAVQAGAQYAMRHSPFDPTRVVGAVRDAVSDPKVLSSLTIAAPTQSCGCADAGGVTAADCFSLCPDGHMAGTYVTVSAQATYIPLLPYPVLGDAVTLAAQATARIR